MINYPSFRRKLNTLGFDDEDTEAIMQAARECDPDYDPLAEMVANDQDMGLYDD